MRRNRSHLRGSVTQNVSARVRVRDQDGIGFLTRLGILAGALFLFLIITVIGWSTGWFQHQTQELKNDFLNLTKMAQFEVKDIVVEGRRQLSKDDILDSLGTIRGAPILSVDVESAAARLGRLPWVDTAVVERRLPDTVAVILTERVPMARWQHDERLYVIDANGRILPAAKPEDFSSLPLIVGLGAERTARDLLVSLKAYPNIGEKVNSAVRVSERRWDLHLPPKITVRLPETDVDKALRRLSTLISEEKILDRNILAIDLRVPDRFVLEPAIGATKTSEPAADAAKKPVISTGGIKKPEPTGGVKKTGDKRP
jgi:cell division protein FtsQ